MLKIPPSRKRPTYQNPRRHLRGRKLQQTRLRIFTEHNYTCAGCGQVTAALELDHVIPLCRGGSDADSNLQPLCAAVCHPKKSKQEGQVTIVCR